MPSLLRQTPAFGLTIDEITAVFEPKNFVGRAPQQVEDFLDGYVDPMLEKNKELLGVQVEINV